MHLKKIEYIECTLSMASESEWTSIGELAEKKHCIKILIISYFWIDFPCSSDNADNMYNIPFFHVNIIPEHLVFCLKFWKSNCKIFAMWKLIVYVEKGGVRFELGFSKSFIY